MTARTRIMYIENTTAPGAARIGRVRFSRTRRTAYFDGRRLRRGTTGRFQDPATGEEFRIAGPRPDGRDAEPLRPRPVLVDEDVRTEYWRDVRGRVLPMACV